MYAISLSYGGGSHICRVQTQHKRDVVCNMLHKIINPSGVGGFGEGLLKHSLKKDSMFSEAACTTFSTVVFFRNLWHRSHYITLNTPNVVSWRYQYHHTTCSLPRKDETCCPKLSKSARPHCLSGGCPSRNKNSWYPHPLKRE